MKIVKTIKQVYKSQAIRICLLFIALAVAIVVVYASDIGNYGQEDSYSVNASENEYTPDDATNDYEYEASSDYNPSDYEPTPEQEQNDPEEYPSVYPEEPEDTPQSIMPLMDILVTFHPNGAPPLATGHTHRTTTTGTAAGGTIGADMPNQPNWHNRIFMGWNTQADGEGDLFTGNTWICATDGPFNVYARWGVRVAFHGNGSTSPIGNNPNNPGHLTYRYIPIGQSIDSTPNVVLPVPVRPGFIFRGWFDSSIADPLVDTPFESDTIVNENLVLFAIWEQLPYPVVTFELEGGVLALNHVLTREALHGQSVNDSSRSYPIELFHRLFNAGVLWPRSAPSVSWTDTTRTLEGWWTEPGGWINSNSVRWASPGASNTAATVSTSLGIFNDYANTPVTGDITVYANWVHRVTFNTNGGTRMISPAESNFYWINNQIRDIPVAHNPGTIDDHAYGRNTVTNQMVRWGFPPDNSVFRAGHTFNGWYTVPYGPNQTPNPSNRFYGDTPVTSNMIVHAHWIPNPGNGSGGGNTAAVTFSLNGRGHWYRVSPTPQPPVNSTANWDVDVLIPSSIDACTNAVMPRFPDSNDYVFVGWYPNPNGNAPRFFHTTLVTEPMTVYASWLPFVELIFNANGGTPAPRSRRVGDGHSMQSMNLIYMIDTVGGTPDPFRYDWWSIANSTTRSGFVRLNSTNLWNTEPDGTGTMVSNADIWNHVPGGSNTVPLYAQWGAQIRFDANLRSITPGMPMMHRDIVVPAGRSFETSSLNNNLPAPIQWPTLRNWDAIRISQQYLRGWNTAADGSGEWIYPDTPINNAMTLFAIWETWVAFHPGTAIDYHPEAVLAENRTRPFVVGEPLGNAMPPDPVWPNHVFRGWFTSIDGRGLNFERNVPISAYATYYASWLAPVTFHPNGGTMAPGAHDTTTIITGNPLLQAITLDPLPADNSHWTFFRWNTQPDGRGRYFWAHYPMITAATDLYAQWVGKINFMLAGGQIGGSVAERYLPIPRGLSVYESEEDMIPDPQHATDSLMPFSHWQVFDGEFAGQIFTVDTPLSPLSNGLMNVIAIWGTPFTVVFDLNGGNVNGNRDPVSHRYGFGRYIGDVEPNAVHDGHRLLGWRLDGTGPIITDVSDIRVEGDMLFVAVWEPAAAASPTPYATPSPTPPPPGTPPPTTPGTSTPEPTESVSTTRPNLPEEEEEEPEDEPIPPADEQVRAHHAYIIGYADGTVRPHANITRAQVATIFFRLMSDSDRAHYWMQTNPFSDVVLNHWFNNGISTTTNAGVFTGMPDGSFQPNRPITRAEFATAVVRHMGMGVNSGDAPMFNDIAGHWAEAYINVAARNGWIVGYAGIGGRFMPNQPITRAEAAALVNRWLGRLPETADDLLDGMRTWPDNANVNAWYYLYIQEASNSHYYAMKANGIHETWTSLLMPERRWELLELPTSVPSDIFR